MPSHKHKKKKKSRKQAKRRVSSSSDDECGLWNVHFSNSDSDDSKNEEKLTSLVRESYVSHLQQALAQNFDDHVRNVDQESKYAMEDLVNKWTSVLEKKALKACMISELYRKTMVSLIREIKNCTSDGRLYIEEKRLSRLKLKVPLNKEIQTIRSEISACEAVTQTEPLLSSLLDLPLPKVVTLSPHSKPYDPAIDFSDSQSSCAGVSSSLNTKLLESSGNQDFCNITSTSDLFDPAEDLIDSMKTTDSTKSSLLFGHLPWKPIERDNGKHFLKAENHLEHVFSKYEDSVESYGETCSGSVGVSDHKQKTYIKTPILSEQVSCSTISKTDNLDARLTAMGLLGDKEIEIESENTISEIPKDKSKKNNWYAEEIAQSCNLTRILLRMSTRQRERALLKMKKLFGNGDELLTELTEENISICRKRIASVVVMELTPIYQAKRIASRILFKFLAKKITRSLMEHSYAPDTRSIRWKVKEFFSDGKVIMAESDCE